MTFNSESESMTVKRLEIALRKMDLQLLKTAGYKLHEKFHSGHKFQYTSELRQILKYVENEKIDEEIKQLVVSTINEILQKNNESAAQNTQKVQEYKQSQIFEEEDDKAYSVPPIYTDSPIEQEQEVSSDGLIPDDVVNYNTAGSFAAQMPKIEYEQPYSTNSKLSDVFVYYEEKNCEIDSRLINEYKKAIASNAPTNEVLNQIKTVLNILNSDLSNLNKILSTLSTIKNKVNFSTSSMNSNLLARFEENSIKYKIPSIFENYAHGSWNFLPIFGQTSVFECTTCGNKFLNRNFEQRSLTMYCDKCSEPSFPQLNLSNFLDGFVLQNTFDALLNSKIWVLINPPFVSDKLENLQIQNLFSLAYKNSTPERIYILTQDADKKEFYKQMFYEINENCGIKSNYLTDENFCEDFIKNEVMSKVYS